MPLLAWLGLGVVLALPWQDERGRDVLYVWAGHNRGWWEALVLGLAGLLTGVALVVLLVALARRTVGTGPRVALGVSLGLAAVVIGGGSLLCSAFLLLINSITSYTEVRAPDGARVVVSLQPVDSPVAHVYRPTHGPGAWTQVDGVDGHPPAPVLDRDDGCTLGLPASGGRPLRCGSVTYVVPEQAPR